MPDALARPEQPASPISFTTIILSLLRSAVLGRAGRARLETVRASMGQMEAMHA